MQLFRQRKPSLPRVPTGKVCDLRPICVAITELKTPAKMDPMLYDKITENIHACNFFTCTGTNSYFFRNQCKSFNELILGDLLGMIYI
jgi:hypothetical protein